MWINHLDIMHRNVIIFISGRLKCSTDGISVVLYFLLSDMPDMQKILLLHVITGVTLILKRLKPKLSAGSLGFGTIYNA